MADGYPKTCVFGDRCLHGGKLKMTSELAMWFHTRVGVVKWAAHADCVREFGLPD